jgi:uncharacterized protein
MSTAESQTSAAHRNTVETAPVAHAILLLVLFFLPAAFPPLQRWPWHFLAPLLAYGAIVFVIPPLRRHPPALGVGRLRSGTVLATAGITLLTVATLLAFDRIVRPDLSRLVLHFPAWFATRLVVACVTFALLNALMEEAIFRAVLFDGLIARLGVPLALVAQAVAFGLAHRHGYPPGHAGTVLAGAFGLALGILRLRSGGLLLPYVPHVAADVTIFVIATRAM